MTGAPARAACGVLVLCFVAWRLGVGPFLQGFRSITPAVLLAAAAITVVSTACSAWRWVLVARGLGVAIALRPAISAYYRSEFLNTVLPGGVLGDVDRGVRHGRDAGAVSASLRAVAWERFAGQVVQVGLALVVLSVSASPVQSSMPALLPAVALVSLAIVALVGRVPERWCSRPARMLRAARADVRHCLLGRRVWPPITLASAIVVTCHVAIFVVAAHTAGTTVAISRLVPIATLVLLAMTLPTNIGGWGPREGVAAWMFAAAGLGAAQGVAVATVYGVLVFAGCLPGAVILLVSSVRGVDPARLERRSALAPVDTRTGRTAGV